MQPSSQIWKTGILLFADCGLRATFGFFLLFFLFLPVFSFNCFADSASQIQRTIRVGAYENPPKVYIDDDGHVVGLFPDVLNSIAEKEGWTLEYVPGTWAQCLRRLDKREIDLMVDMAYSLKRAEKYTFTRETFLINWAAVYGRREQGVESLIDLSGKKIAVMKGSIHTEGDGGIKQLVRKFGINCSFVEVDSYRAVFEMLAKKAVDAGVVNRIFGSLFAEEYELFKTPIIFNPRHLKCAFPKDAELSSALKERIDYHLREEKKDPASIYNKALNVYLFGLPRELIFSEADKISAEAKPRLTAAEKRWIRDHPVIRLGIDPEFAPFEYLDSKGIYSGMVSEYIQILNKQLGLNMQVVKNLTWKEAVEKAKNREIDVLPCVDITWGRRAFLTFTKPYINYNRVIISRTDMPFLTGLGDIKEMRVAVQEDSSHAGYLHDNTDIDPYYYRTQQDAVMAVSSGQADIFIGNIASSTYWIRKFNLTNLKVAAPVSQQVQGLHFAVRNDWPELAGILNKGLSYIGRERESAIRRRWVSVNYEPGIAPHLVRQYVVQITVVAFLFLLLILSRNHRLKKELQKRIEIERKLSEANKDLKALDQLKSMFIASMSHELRTPLNSVIGFTGIILQGMAGPLNDKQKDHLTRVYNSAKHLLFLITDVIDISKIEAGRIDVFAEDFLLAEVVDEAVVNIEPQLRVKKLQLDISIPADLQLHTDRKRLLQCIINYLSNAVKFTEAGGVAIIAERCGDNVEILVSDTGIGISPDNQSKLFVAFERLDSHLRIKAGGTGLGLYLTRKLTTEILGGEIFVRSEEGKGSTFGLLIPVNLTPRQQNEEVDP